MNIRVALSAGSFLSAALLAFSATTAVATPVVTMASTQRVSLSVGANGSQSAMFGTTHLKAGLFTDTFFFADTASLALVNGGLSTIGFSAAFDIDFITATLNDVAFDFKKISLGRAFEAFEIGKFTNQELFSPFTLIVNGRAGQGLTDGAAIAATYSGNLNVSRVTQVSQVPEPSSFALLAAGLAGLAGAAFVSRRRRVLKINA
jgi:hypothetical protein